jgi:hypothetical protein
MLNRRSALAVLGSTGIGTAVFQRALAARAGCGPVSPQMVAEAEWVAGTLLTLAHACQRAIGLTHRPPLDQFLAQKDEILAGEEFPDENKYYTD